MEKKEQRVLERRLKGFLETCGYQGSGVIIDRLAQERFRLFIRVTLNGLIDEEPRGVAGLILSELETWPVYNDLHPPLLEIVWRKKPAPTVVYHQIQ